MFTFTVPDSSDPLELSDLLRRLKVSLTLRRKLKQADGAVRLNGRPVPWKTRLYPGDTISIVWPQYCKIAPLPLPLTVVFEDDALLVVDKPAGLLSHPATDPSRPSLANAVIRHLQAQDSPAGFHPVHRLDRNTSGLMLIAKNPYIQHLFSSKDGITIKRDYLAVIPGILDPAAGIIDAPIGRRPDSIIERMVCQEGQKAVTCYQTIQILGQNSVIKLNIMTGRTHQIRVHLAYTGHPIFGDDLYGGSRKRIGRQALHAAGLSFTHPLTGTVINLTSPLPPDIRALLDQLQTDS